jgi:hypothetical protein
MGGDSRQTPTLTCRASAAEMRWFGSQHNILDMRSRPHSLSQMPPKGMEGRFSWDRSLPVGYVFHLNDAARGNSWYPGHVLVDGVPTAWTHDHRDGECARACEL